MLKPALHESTRRYINDSRVACAYDNYFAGQNLFTLDCAILEQWFNQSADPKPVLKNRFTGSLIDLGCGTGRHLLYFARRGFEVTGVDISEYMLAVAKAKLEQARVSARLINADFCNLTHEKTQDQEVFQAGSYDYALCMFSTIGLIYGRDNRLKFLQTVRRLLKPTGQLALHVHNKAHNIWRHEGRVFLLSNFVKSCLALAEVGDKFLSSYRGIKGMYVHVFTETEITQLLQEAGFKVEKVLALNRRRNGVLQCNFLRSLRANGFLIRAWA